MPDLKDGESTEMQGSGAKPYVLKNTGGVYSCSCPAWRNQSAPIEARTCKHLSKLRGEEAERKRVGGALPARPVSAKADKDVPALLLAQSWDNAMDLSGWWMSEKLDGVRAYWDGKQFWSRQGNLFHAPDFFLEGLPDVPLDGELWIDRGQYQKTVSFVRRQDKSDHWKDVRYLVFDAPKTGGNFEARLAFIKDCIGTSRIPYAECHSHKTCRGLAHLREELERVEGLRGEGLMFRQPNSNYEAGRSFTLLKVKTFHDAEATVVAHQSGKGKFKGLLGALMVEMPNGTRFSVGTGISNAQRGDPPPIGSVITYRFQELTDAGVPRFPSFVRLEKKGSPVVAGDDNDAKMAKKASSKVTRSADSAPRHREESLTTFKGYYEFKDDKSAKFWEISVDGPSLTIRFGRIGTAGTTQAKHFADGAATARHAQKLIAEKTGKGYVEAE